MWIKSRRAPEPEGFVEHSSKIDQVAEKTFLVVWRYGDIQSLYMDPAESASSANLKRGLASLFQYRTLDDEVRQRDASGLCDVAYVSSDERRIEKRKTSCAQSTLPPSKRHPNPIFAVNVESSRNSTYTLTQSLLPEYVIEREAHWMTLSAKSDIGTVVTSQRTLERSPRIVTASTVQADSLKHAVALLQPGYRERSIELQSEPTTCPDAGCPTVRILASSNVYLTIKLKRRDL